MRRIYFFGDQGFCTGLRIDSEQAGLGDLGEIHAGVGDVVVEARDIAHDDAPGRFATLRVFELDQLAPFAAIADDRDITSGFRAVDSVTHVFIAHRHDASRARRDVDLDQPP